MTRSLRRWTATAAVTSACCAGGLIAVASHAAGAGVRPAAPTAAPSGLGAAAARPARAAPTATMLPGSRRGSMPKLIWGPVTLADGQSAFPIYHQLGVKVFQIDLTWSEVAATRPADPTNPADPAYQWPPQIALAVSQARQYGMKICLLVQTTPAWANGGRADTRGPTDPDDYGRFLTAAAREYASVHLWMIWGEPNRNGNLEPMPSNSNVGPRRYALLLNSAYHALKGVSTANLVIGGDTWSFGDVEPASFVRWMRLPDGKPPPLDYYGHNPFSIRFPDISDKPYFPGGRDINDIDTLETELQSTYHRAVPLWLSEFTVSSGRPNRAFSFAVSRAAQARWVTAAFTLANTQRYVAGMGWFNLADEPPTSADGLTNGLMTWDLKPKPAFYAYQRSP
jgi:hypothetical protein